MGNIAEILRWVKVMFEEHPIAAWTLLIGVLTVALMLAIAALVAQLPPLLAMLKAIGWLGG